MSERRIDIDAVELEAIIAGLQMLRDSTTTLTNSAISKVAGMALIVMKEMKPVVPETPAWYYAEDGEIWELSSDEAVTRHYVVSDYRFLLLPLIDTDDRALHPTRSSDEFSNGRLIWSAEGAQ